MEIRFITDESEFINLRGEWDQLLAGATTRTPFQRHDYLEDWWSTLGGGEWKGGNLRIAAGRDSSGQLVGIAPFFNTETEDGRNRLLFLGSIEISDYLDLIVYEERASEFSTELIGALEDQPWDMLDLYNIPSASGTIDHLSNSAGKLGWRVERERIEPSPVIYLAGSWDDYLASLESKQRREFRRKMRRAAEFPASVTWRIVGEGDDLAEEMDEFMDLMALDPKKHGFLTQEMRDQFHRTALTAHEGGWLQLALLEVGGKPVCGYYNFDLNGRLWIYNSGIDPDYYNLSPGWVLMGHLIKWALENDRTAVDFMRGDEEYKFRLGGSDDSIDRLTISRDS
jgi:CelD/BcsL family acetyltransferase involved in cellulose biosynthesis